MGRKKEIWQFKKSSIKTMKPNWCLTFCLTQFRSLFLVFSSSLEVCLFYLFLQCKLRIADTVYSSRTMSTHSMILLFCPAVSRCSIAWQLFPTLTLTALKKTKVHTKRRYSYSNVYCLEVYQLETHRTVSDGVPLRI